MKTTFIITIILIFTKAVCAQDSTVVINQVDSISQSHFLGFYKTCSILGDAKKEKLNQKKNEITEEIEKIKQILSVKIEADTISVPLHTTLLYDLITIPKLNDKQKQAKKHKKDIQNLKKKLSKLECELKNIEALEKKDREFYAKSLLWGLVYWKVKR